ncbi:unnamed protein product [Arabidopsis lyrata]|uniref:uncharacterized protein LOC9314178 n=1 Tax=Arabidopsis lyrata subsp. lyrata TaxID=81972 RepID=UPI000A29E859|nr:uncharacterized protein LOC9314178 [Arabidopsis lyrata subsp. lyrata]CAH8268859.1 unnamed protein product [Arabidopsis lyrata]|eukprot:XP_020880088.1 uncharacterized protein LOC9314178 [Arabidopsis lyrata subsp. lyrata]
MKKSKRENLLSPSSSWRENHNPPRKDSNSSAVSSGCLPGFFNLFLSTFSFSSNRRKSITLGSKKREQKTVVYASPPQDSSNGDGGRIVAPPLPRNEGDGDAARVSLVGALEKCDRDLEELRRTIDVIKTTYILHKKLEVSPPTTRENFKFSGTVAGDVVVRTQTQKNTKTTRHEPDTATMLSMMNHHEYCKDIKPYKVNNINLITRPDHYAIHDVISKRATSTTTTESCGTLPLVVRRVRRSLMESVNQVCDDVASGQRREVAKIGLALHDHICRDLIAETVRELSFSDYDDDEFYKSPVDSSAFNGGGGKRRHIRRGSSNSLPLDACRRRLVF